MFLFRIHKDNGTPGDELKLIIIEDDVWYMTDPISPILILIIGLYYILLQFIQGKVS